MSTNNLTADQYSAIGQAYGVSPECAEMIIRAGRAAVQRAVVEQQVAATSAGEELTANIDRQMAIIDAHRLKRLDRRLEQQPVEFDRRTNDQDRRAAVRRGVEK